MTQQESINKFLTEQRGECWHIRVENPKPKDFGKGRGWFAWKCERCGLENPPENVDFFTREGFGKLWDWVRKDWKLWADFVNYLINKLDDRFREFIIISIILELVDNPKLFATELAKFLGWKEE